MAKHDIDPALMQAILAKQRRLALADCFDALNLESRPNAKQQEFFNDIGKYRVRWAVCGNQSGKSTSGARELAWILNGDHPHWTRPKAWGDGPLKCIIAGKSRDIIQLELWEGKLKPLLYGNWKEVKRQSYVVGAQNEDTGDYILFIPHGTGSDDTVDRMQGYVAHYAWCDEMPEKAKVISELQMRINSKQGYFVGTFTPLAVNAEIKNMVDAADGVNSKRYIFTLFDNPLYHGREDEILAMTATWPARERRARLYGEWYQSDTAVYDVDRKAIQLPWPETYSVKWPHYLSVDPAGSSNTGLVVIADDVASGISYVIKAKYLREKDPQTLVQLAEKEVLGLNVVKRVSDVNPFFITTAQRLGYLYHQPYKKTERKMELIKNLQTEISQWRLYVIRDTCDALMDELETCRFGTSGDDSIVHSQRFHLLDALQYCIDIKPKMVNNITVAPVQPTWADKLMAAHEQTQIKKQTQPMRVSPRRRRRY